MASLPKPLIALLVGTVAFFALWMVALKPSNSSNSSGSQGVGAYQSAINKAHQAVAVSGAASAAHGGTVATTPPATTPSATTPPAKTPSATKSVASTPAPKASATGGASISPNATPAHARAKAAAKSSHAATLSTAAQVNMLESALRSNKEVAVLFYNGASADDVAVKKELAAVPAHRGKVVKLAVPLSELTAFAGVTQQVPVVAAPTLVLIDGHRQATEIVGFTDSFEIGQRVSNSLATR